MVARIFKTYGQGVDLILNSENGLSLGPELVANGDFSSGLDGWTANAAGAATVLDGLATITNVTNGSKYITQAFSAEVGKRYAVKFDVKAVGGGAAAARVGAGFSTSSESAGVGTFAVGDDQYLVITPTSTTTYVRFGPSGTGPGFSAAVGNISVREIIGADRVAVQTNTSLQPILGRAPVRGRVNLLTHTKQFDNAVWLKTNGTITANATTAPDGTLTASKFTPVTAASASVGRGVFAVSSSPFTNSICVKYAGFTWCRLIDTQGNKSAYFNLLTGEFGVVSAGITGTTVKPLADGWWKISVSSTVTYVNFYFGVVDADGSPAVTGDGTSGIYICEPQAEYGSVVTQHQTVGTTLHDVTERNLSSPGYLRFDLTDDKLTHTFPDGFTGDVFIAGRNGSWVESGISIAAGGTMDIGPTSITGGPTPGILRALGDIVGWVPVGRTLTEDDKAALVAHFRKKGAKGLLGLGPELVTTAMPRLIDATNGSWAEDLSFTRPVLVETTVTVSVSGNRLRDLSRNLSNTIYYNALGAGFFTGFSYYNVVGTTSYRHVRPPYSGGARVWVTYEPGGGSVDSFSVRELIPEEEL